MTLNSKINNELSGFYNNNLEYSIVLNFNKYVDYISIKNFFTNNTKYNFLFNDNDGNLIFKWGNERLEEPYNFIKKFRLELNLESIQ